MVTGAPSPWNLPNALTASRIAAVPVLAWALLHDGGHSVTWRIIATVLFVLAAATDQLDGYLARRNGTITDFGKLMDPIADKLLIGTVLILLAWPLGEIPWWVPAVILTRELGITVMRMAILKYTVLPASRGGKLKTFLQSIAITLFLLPLAHLPGAVRVVAWVFLVAAIIQTVVTGVEYLGQGVRLARAGRRAAALDERGAGG